VRGEGEGRGANPGSLNTGEAFHLPRGREGERGEALVKRQGLRNTSPENGITSITFHVGKMCIYHLTIAQGDGRWKNRWGWGGSAVHPRTVPVKIKGPGVVCAVHKNLSGIALHSSHRKLAGPDTGAAEVYRGDKYQKVDRPAAQGDAQVKGRRYSCQTDRRGTRDDRIKTVEEVFHHPSLANGGEVKGENWGVKGRKNPSSKKNAVSARRKKGPGPAGRLP